MLTYADENAKGFFKKQGFSETILIQKSKWKGYIKDYDNATLRCCQILPQVNYWNVKEMINRQREVVYRLAASRSHHATVYHLPEGSISNVMDIPGVREAGWDEESLAEKIKLTTLQDKLGQFLTMVWNHSDSWPFRQPVNVDVVENYLSVIKKPMGKSLLSFWFVDLSTMKSKLQNGLYTSPKSFLDDLHLITSNCKTFNTKQSSYFKCADNIEKFIQAHSGEILK